MILFFIFSQNSFSQRFESWMWFSAGGSDESTADYFYLIVCNLKLSAQIPNQTFMTHLVLRSFTDGTFSLCSIFEQNRYFGTAVVLWRSHAFTCDGDGVTATLDARKTKHLRNFTTAFGIQPDSIQNLKGRSFFQNKIKPIFISIQGGSGWGSGCSSMWEHAWAEQHANGFQRPWPVCLGVQLLRPQMPRMVRAPAALPPQPASWWCRGGGQTPVLFLSRVCAADTRRVRISLQTRDPRVFLPAAPPPTEMQQVTATSGEFRHARLHGDAPPLTLNDLTNIHTSSPVISKFLFPVCVLCCGPAGREGLWPTLPRSPGCWTPP